MVDRRQLLATATAVATTLALHKPALAASGEAAKLNALFEAFFQENLRLNPESATLLGLDKEANADLYGKLHDESAASIAAATDLNASQMARLKTIDASKLSGLDRVGYDTVLYTCEITAGVRAFDFGGISYGSSPYVVSQLTLEEENRW